MFVGDVEVDISPEDRDIHATEKLDLVARQVVRRIHEFMSMSYANRDPEKSREAMRAMENFLAVMNNLTSAQQRELEASAGLNEMRSYESFSRKDSQIFKILTEYKNINFISENQLTELLNKINMEVFHMALPMIEELRRMDGSKARVMVKIDMEKLARRGVITVGNKRYIITFMESEFNIRDRDKDRIRILQWVDKVQVDENNEILPSVDSKYYRGKKGIIRRQEVEYHRTVPPT